MKKPSFWVLATLAAVLIAGCANQRAPAAQPVAAVESALTNIRDMANRDVLSDPNKTSPGQRLRIP